MCKNKHCINSNDTLWKSTIIRNEKKIGINLQGSDFRVVKSRVKVVRVESEPRNSMNSVNSKY